MAIVMKIDHSDGTITYGKDDTEHLTSRPTMQAWLDESLAQMNAGQFVTVTLEDLQRMIGESSERNYK